MKKLIIFSFVALYLVALMPISIAKAQTAADRTASFAFSPSSGNIELNSSGQFSVDINVDTGGKKISGVDVTVTFNSNEVTYISGTVDTSFLKGNPYPFPTSSTGTLRAGAFIPLGDPAVYVTGTGKIGTLVFAPAVTNGVRNTTTATFNFAMVDGATDDNTSVVSPDYPNFDILGSAPSATLTFVDYTNGDSNLPSITSFSPHEGLHDTDVIMVINGTNFTDTEGNVYIGTRSAIISSWSDSQIYIIVPQNPDVTDSDSGPHQVKVTRTDGENATADGYTYLAQPSTDGNGSNGTNGSYPNITSIAPRSGEEGYDVVVDIWGDNFGSFAGTFSMGSLGSRVLSWADGHIVVTAYGSGVNISEDTWYPITVTRTDGLSDTFHGFMVTTGIGFIPLLGGLLILNGGAAILVKRKWFS